MQKKFSKMLDIRRLDDTIAIDIRYATTNNFTQTKIYDRILPALVPAAAKALVKVHKSLAKKGLGLKIWDAYRSTTAQEFLWSVKPDARYVADPSKNPPHCRGVAVDLTLVNIKTGVELAMPTEYDNFTPRAHRGSEEWTPDQRKHCLLLENEMTRCGFVGLPTEWWHFEYRPSN